MLNEEKNMMSNRLDFQIKLGFHFLDVMPQKLGDTILIPAKSPSLTFNKVEVWRCHRRRRKMMTRFLDPHSHLRGRMELGRNFWASAIKSCREGGRETQATFWLNGTKTVLNSSSGS